MSGNSVIAQYPCILDGKRFYVLIGSTDIALFGKSTFLNLANLAEAKCAEDMILILNRAHEQKSQYDRVFKVIDAERMKTS